MEGMAKSVNALVGRVSVLEKGPPSHQPKVTVTPAAPAPLLPNPWPFLPPPARAGPFSARPLPAPAPVRPSSSTASSSSSSSTAARPGPSSARQASHSTGLHMTNRKPNTDPNLNNLPNLDSDILERTPSANPDFPKLCKALYYVCQLRRHTTNWQTLPRAISRDLSHLASNIKPIHPSAELVADISSLFSRTGDDLRDRVARHFSERLDLNLTALRTYNPLDKEQAVEVVIKQITLRLGSKGTTFSVRTLVEGEAKAIWSEDKARQSTEGERKVTSDEDTRFVRKPNPAKKSCHMITPPTTVFNRYSVLADLDADTVEPDSPLLTRAETKPVASSKSPLPCDLNDSPSPPRKTPRRLPNDPLSSPKTTVSFTPLTSTRTIPHGTTSTSTASYSVPTESSSSITAVPPMTTPASSLPPPPSSSSSPPRYSRHLGDNKGSWKIHLRPDTRTLILSDSNCRDLTEQDIPTHFQLECFSGANFSNALQLVQKLPNAQLDNLVIAMGINHKQQVFRTRTLPAINIFFEHCRPKARVVTAVGVSINPHLPDSETTNLAEINHTLQSITHNKYVKPLTSNQIDTHGDMVHYTRDTQTNILSRILQHCNTTPKN